jgi:hypothetical protein
VRARTPHASLGIFIISSKYLEIPGCYYLVRGNNPKYDKGTLMNVWALGGFAGVGFLVFFLTQTYGSSEKSNLYFLAERGEPAIALVVLALLAITGFAFYMAVKQPNK